MAQAQPQSNEPDLDFIESSDILVKKQEKLDELNEEETYVIKSLKDGKLEIAYEGVFDFSTPAGKAEFEVLKKIISPNNWIVIPSPIFQKYEEEAISIKELEEATAKNHEKLNLYKPNFDFVKESKVNDDFISNISDVQADSSIKNLTKESAPKTGISAGEAVARKPSEILTSMDESVKNKLNELSYQKSRIERSKGMISVKPLALAGGVFALGVVFGPLLAITIPASIAIGGYAILKGLFHKNPDIKNYDQQIELLKEATATMVLKRTDDDTKSNINNFVKHNKGLSGTLFDERIEAEFARLCKKSNVKIDRNVFKNAHLYENGHVVEFNREVKENRKNKM